MLVPYSCYTNLLDTCYTPDPVFPLPARAILLNFIPWHWKRQASVLRKSPTIGSVSWTVQSSPCFHGRRISIWKLELFPNHCGMSANIRLRIMWSQLEASILGRRVLGAAASWLSSKHSRGGWLLRHRVLHFTVTLTPNNFSFSLEMEKERKVFPKVFRFLLSLYRSSNQKGTIAGFEPPCHPSAWCKQRHPEGQLVNLH